MHGHVISKILNFLGNFCVLPLVTEVAIGAQRVKDKCIIDTYILVTHFALSLTPQDCHDLRNQSDWGQ
jgi:hypothetical protein